MTKHRKTTVPDAPKDVGRRVQELVGLDAEEKLMMVRGVGAKNVEQLIGAGVASVEDLAQCDPEALEASTGLGLRNTRRLKGSAGQWLTYEAGLYERAESLGIRVVDGVVQVPDDPDWVPPNLD